LNKWQPTLITSDCFYSFELAGPEICAPGKALQDLVVRPNAAAIVDSFYESLAGIDDFSSIVNKHSDAALYAAKLTGRDCVRIEVQEPYRGFACSGDDLSSMADR
jgi:hypothetical protein